MLWPISACALALILAFVLYRLAGLNERASRFRLLEEDLQKTQEQKEILQAKVTELSVRLEEEKNKAVEKEAFVAKAQDAFKALSLDVLKETQTSFFSLAKETFDQRQVAIGDVVKPLSESLKLVDTKIQELEKTRVGAYATLSEHLRTLAASQGMLQSETAKLAKALRAPAARGMWGEIQLKRVIELAGMVAYCDFVEQHTFDSPDGKMRPDVVVRLPNSRSVVIDAKTPLLSYLEAVDLDSDDKKAVKLKEHAKHLKKHMGELGEKAYWERIQPAPEFVVLFMPSEAFFSAALEYDPTLIEYGVDKKVLIATPTTLIALLRAVAYGWKEGLVAKHAQEISEVGKSLHERLKTMTEHLVKLKRSIDNSVDSYNKVVGCFETRVMPAARRFEDMQVVGSEPIVQLQPVESILRSIESDNY
jgi:DNA recombination protein RmuC